MKKCLKFLFGSFAVLCISAFAAGCNQGSSGRPGVSPVSTQQAPGPVPGGPSGTPIATTSDGFAESQATAFELTLGWMMQSQIDHPRDQDWYKVYLNAGETVAFVATGSTSIWLQSSSGVVQTGLTATLTMSRATAGYVYMFIEDEWYLNTPSYSITANLVTGTTPTSPPMGDPVTVTLVHSGASRQVGANLYSLVMDAKVLANEDVQVIAARVGFDSPLTATNMYAYTPLGFWNSGVVTQTDPWTAEIAAVNSNGFLSLAEKEAGILSIYADGSGKDNFALRTTLMDLQVRLANGAEIWVNVWANETVILEAPPNLAHLAPANTVAQVTSGTTLGQVAEFESRNLSTIHTTHMTQIDVDRLTAGDTDPLKLVDLVGNRIDNGSFEYDTTSWDGTQWVNVRRVVFVIPVGNLIVPAATNTPGSVRWRLVADTSNSHLAVTEYAVSQLISQSDNGQTLGQGGFWDSTNATYVRFRLERQ